MIAITISRTNLAAPIRRVPATCRVPFGLMPVTAARTPRNTASPSQTSQVIPDPAFQETSQRSQLFTHPLDAPFDIASHGRDRCRQMPRPVSRQHPLEGEVEESLHRANLLLPGIPAGGAEGDQAAPPGGPGE